MSRVQHLEVTNQQLDSKVQHLSILNQKYEHELALFKQHKFGSKNEHLTAKQIHLWDEAVEEDIAAVDLELERLNADKTDAVTQKAKTNKPKRRPLPDHLHTHFSVTVFWYSKYVFRTHFSHHSDVTSDTVKSIKIVALDI